MMLSHIRIKTNAGMVARQFNDIAAKHLPFATARALTWTAQDGQKEVRRELPHQFILRTNYLEQNVGITPATKKEWTSIVGFKTSSSRSTDFMELQQDGGLKTPMGKMLAVPSKARLNKRGLIKKNQKPAALMKKKNVFLGRPKGGGRPLGIYARSGHHSLTLMYLLIPMAGIKQRLNMDKTVDKVVSNRFQRLFNLSLDMALRSAK